MNANEFTWEQRGAIDQMLAVSFSTPPDGLDLVQRIEWETGWQKAWERESRRVLRIIGDAEKLMLSRMQKS